MHGATMSLSFAFALLSALPDVAPSIDGTALAQLTIERRVVIRVPVMPMNVVPMRPIRMVEKKGPKCVMASDLGGAFVSGPRQIDLYLRGGARLRAELDRQCNAVDLRFGFYIRPNRDGQMCSDRDMIHARTGGQCDIERFRTLVPER
jgi:hypothetical protein